MALVVLLLGSARKEYDTGEPITGIIPFAVLIVGLCAFIALSVTYVDRHGIVPLKTVTTTR